MESKVDEIEVFVPLNRFHFDFTHKFLISKLIRECLYHIYLGYRFRLLVLYVYGQVMFFGNKDEIIEIHM
jgi:hypothetical protein